ncbi:MAG: HNH endonuclease [Candidatus Nanoarchaeia archaeon]|jgi:endogenous inhibitor of DNA gyrase (YacG/DUF329 family)
MISKNCSICGKEYFVHLYRENTSQFCSKKCKHLGFKGHVSAMKGKHLSDELKLKLSKAHLGKHLSEEHKNKLSLVNKGINLGIKRSKETKQKLSKSHLEYFKNHKHVSTGKREKCTNVDYTRELAREKVEKEKGIKVGWKNNKTCVHHIDGNPFNNNINNLMVLTLSEHTKLHHKQGDIFHV